MLNSEYTSLQEWRRKEQEKLLVKAYHQELNRKCDQCVKAYSERKTPKDAA
ncbi:MAG: hypothetical protein JXR30_03445 [Alphaproteobacteria bacterium]|nr:hypothetical protein [Alphaproteobacteria bacterium]